MKKYLVLLVSSLIILVACEHEKPKKEYTSQKIDKKVDNKKKDNNKNQTENSSSNQSITQNFQLNQDKSQFVNKKQPENQFNHAQYINGKQGQHHNEWYQAPGNGDAIGYITPDGTQCTVGGCVSPSQQNSNQKTYDYEHNEIYRTKEEQKAHEQWIQDQVNWSKQHQN